MMRGLRLVTSADLSVRNPDVGDLYLDERGDLVGVTGEPATMQEIRSALLFCMGENPLDLRDGVPWFQQLLEKNVPEARMRSALTKAILSVPDVDAVLRLDIETDRATRASSVAFEVRTVAGKRISSEDFGPVILGGTNGGT
jgi:hypothetical protein